MAYTPAPETQTYSTHRLPIVYDYKLRSGATQITDANTIAGTNNILPLKIKGEEELIGISRPGIDMTSITTGADRICRGVYVWEKYVGTNLYNFIVAGDGTSTYVYSQQSGGAWSLIHTLADTALTPVRFTEFITDTNVKYLVMVTGTLGYYFTTNAAGTQITDADFPNPHIPFPVFLNGRMYLAKKNTGDIYNSALNDLTNWTAGDYISSEVYPDDIQALVKINNYIAAIGATGTEYFYDNANPTGSPLARYEGGLMPFGTIFPNTIAESKGKMTFLSRHNDGGLVLKTVNGFDISEQKGEAVSTSLSYYLSQTSGNAARMRGNYFRLYDSLFYLLTYDGTLGVGDTVVANSGITSMVYCFETKTWHRFSSTITQHNSQFPVCFVAQSNSESSAVYVAGATYTMVFFGTFSEVNTSDEGSIITQELHIPPQTFGTHNRKFMHRVALNVESATTTPFLLSWNDNQAATSWATARTFGGTYDSDGGFPFVNQLGSFRSREFKISVSTAGAVARWNFMEVDINKGQQ